MEVSLIPDQPRPIRKMGLGMRLQWRCVGTVEVIQNKQTATELFTIQPEAGARSPQKPLKATHKDREFKDALRKLC